MCIRAHRTPLEGLGRRGLGHIHSPSPGHILSPLGGHGREQFPEGEDMEGSS